MTTFIRMIQSIKSWVLSIQNPLIKPLKNINLIKVPSDWYKQEDEQLETRDIRRSYDPDGHSFFSTLSRDDKSKYIFNKFSKPIMDVYYKSEKNGIWHIPCYTSVKKDLIENRKVNRYLKHQEDRIRKAIKEGKQELATRVFLVLMQRSWGFRIACLNYKLKGWYFNMNYKAFESLLRKLDHILRTMCGNPKFFRVYIDKPDGRKRPLGVPTKAWRVVLHMLNSYLTLLVPQTISKQQYGFIPGKGGVDAWKHILETLTPDKHLYEFDLDGCFNKISVKHCLWILKYDIGLPTYFIAYMESILTANPLLLESDEVDEDSDKELTKTEYGFYRKDGLPQGFSISALLSVMVIDRAMKYAGLDEYIMYADDGLLIMDNKTELTMEQRDQLAAFGLFFSNKIKKNGEKSCRWVEDEFTFLGARYSRSRESFLLNGEWIHKSLINDRVWSDIIYNGYDGSKKRWTWSIDPDCFSLRNKSISSIRNWRRMLRWIDESPMIQRCGLLFLDAQKESSDACAKLLRSRVKFSRGSYIQRVRMESKFAVHHLDNVDDLINDMDFDCSDMYEEYPYTWVELDWHKTPTFRMKMDGAKRESLNLKVFKMPVVLKDPDHSIWLDPSFD